LIKGSWAKAEVPSQGIPRQKVNTRTLFLEKHSYCKSKTFSHRRHFSPVARERFLNRGGGYIKFRFAKKMANHLHQPVISMGAGPYTLSSHLTGTRALGDFGGFTSKIIHL